MPSVLAYAREVVAPAMTQSLDRLSPQIRAVIDYHMGWKDVHGNPVQLRSSKSVRPALALLAARLGDQDPVAAVPGALSVEFIHNWAFLIDDVMDRDRFRRQRETAWVVFGEGQAICAGTALLTLSQQVLLEAASPHRLDALALALETAERMLAGQTLDMTFEQRTDFTIEESMTMTTMKTASLMRCAISIGAVLVGAPGPVIAGLTEYGRCLGVAFQARDDMLGIWGEPAQTGGRPPGFDLRARKGTLPIAVARNHGGSPSGELHDLLAKPELSDAEVRRCADLVQAAGGREWTATLARDMVAEAMNAVDSLGIDQEVLDNLAEIAAMGLPDDIA